MGFSSPNAEVPKVWRQLEGLHPQAGVRLLEMCRIHGPKGGGEVVQSANSKASAACPSLILRCERRLPCVQQVDTGKDALPHRTPTCAVPLGPEAEGLAGMKQFCAAYHRSP